MEKETITVELVASSKGVPHDPDYLKDSRTLHLEGTRGDISKKLDDFCRELEANFGQ